MLIARDGHAHVRLLGRHVQFGEQTHQRRIRAPVVDDEAGVDTENLAFGSRHVVGVRVAADAIVRLVEGDVRAPLEHMCRGETCDAATDHSDPATPHRPGVPSSVGLDLARSNGLVGLPNRFGTTGKIGSVAEEARGPGIGGRSRLCQSTVPVESARSQCR